MRRWKVDLPNDTPIVEKPLIVWITLPNGEPGVLCESLDIYGEETRMIEEIIQMTAKDRFGRFWSFPPQENTFYKPKMN